jgi:hypothetical protein
MCGNASRLLWTRVTAPPTPLRRTISVWGAPSWRLQCASTSAAPRPEVVTATGARSVREPFAGLISRVPLSGMSRSRETGSDVGFAFLLSSPIMK